MRILAGDIGGTKTALALYERQGAAFAVLREATYASHEHASLSEVVRMFCDGNALRVDAAGFGVAGPVRAGVCETTNLPWRISVSELEHCVGAPVAMVNDLHAATHGVREVEQAYLHTLNEGSRDPGGPIAVVGAGTGLGEAIGLPSADGLEVLSGEGGHADFAPRSEPELRLLQFLSRRYGHVSWERVASGMALADLYDFVVADGQARENAVTRERFAGEDAGAVLAERALSGQDRAAELAVELCLSALAAECGNVALRVLPTGGLYLVGGVARKQLPPRDKRAFLAGFLAKGRMSKILENIPVFVVTDARVGLLGARAVGALLSGR